MESREDGQQQGIQSVETAMRILGAIEGLGGPAGLSKIADVAGLTPSAAHRYLVSLVRSEMVSQDASSGQYNFGAAARRIGIEAVRRTDDVSIATPYASALRDSTGHTVNICVWTDNGPTIVRWEYGQYPLPIVARIGSTLPIADSSVGRVFMAYLPSSVTRQVLQAQRRFGESSDYHEDELLAIVERVRADGLATTTNAVLLGQIVTAAPVFGPDGTLALTLAAVVPSRFASPRVRSTVEAQLRETATRLSADLGARAAPPASGTEHVSRRGRPRAAG
jgi:DNA-binding IclR family transcriptional regulator